MTRLLSLYGRTVNLIVIVFVISFTVLTLAFLSISAMEERDQVRDLEKIILQANAGVRDFMLTRDPQDAKDTEVLLQVADQSVRDGIRESNYRHLHNEVLMYLHTINNLIEVYQERGFYEEEGLEGQIRNRLNRIESELQAVGASEAVAALLTARRMEKNFLLRSNMRYVDGVHDAVDELMRELIQSGLPSAKINSIHEELGEYQYEFDELVSLSRRAEWIQEDLKVLQRAIANTLSHVVGLEQRRARTFMWSALGLMLVAFVFGILYAMYVARSVLKPLDSVGKLMKRVADGEDLSADEWATKEVASAGLTELMDNFKDVAEQVRLRKAAEEDLQVSKQALQQYANELEDRTEQLDVAVKDLETARDSAESDSRLKAEFLASMSHEIRTPLNGIIGMTSLLDVEDMTQDQQEVVDVIRTSGESLLSVVNHVLDFSKIEAGAMDLESEPFSLHDCIEDALGMVSRQAAEKGLDLSNRIDTCVPSRILGDEARVRQILINLLGNAVKFTHDGEIQVRVECSERGSNSLLLHFAVEDTGIGIDKEHMDGLFDPFKQADSSTSRRFGGTGLGLTISQRLTTLMGGSMWVESEVGRGSTFHFTAHVEVEPGVEPVARFEVPGRQRILLLSRNRLFEQSVRQTMSMFDLSVDAVRTEEEASQRLLDHEYFAVFINECKGGFEGVAGVAVARLLKGAAPETPFVVLRHIHQQMGDEHIQCLIKPVRYASIKQFVQRIAGLQTAQRIIPIRGDAPVGGDGESRIARLPDREAVSRPSYEVLLVEDNPVNQKVGVRMLSRLGCAVTVVDGGEKAVEAVRNGSFSHVFMDVQMPGMNGLEATREIRKLSSSTAQPAIIALTASATTADRHDCIEAGMDDYASKPVDPKTLKLLLDRYPPGVRRSQPSESAE